VREPGRTADPSAAPDFLSTTVASVDFMRLSNGESHTLPLVEPRSRKSGCARDDKWRVVTFIRDRQIGWTEKKRQLHF
jgi:hypothetical protein